MERSVEIPVSKKLRDEIRDLKRELTYEEFLFNLIEKKGSTPRKGTNPKASTGGS